MHEIDDAEMFLDDSEDISRMLMAHNNSNIDDGWGVNEILKNLQEK